MIGWKTAILGDLVERPERWNPRMAKDQDEIPYIDIGSIDQDSKVISETKNITAQNAPSRARQLVRHGDIIVSTVRPNLNAVARVPQELDGAVASTGFCVLRPRPHLLDGQYLFHWVKSKRFVADMVKKATGASYPAVTDGTVFESRLPLPPLPEQRRIAAILDKADELRAKRRAAIEKLDRLVESIFLEMFGDFRRDPHRWQVVKFADVVRETKLGLVRSSLQIRPDAPYPYVRMDAITTSGRLDLGNVLRTTATDSEIEEYHVRPGDLLFNTRNSKELVGKTAVFRSKGLFLFNNNLLRITLNEKAHPEYVAAAMRTPFVRRELNLRKSGTTSVFAIYYKDLRTLPLPLPPKALQEEFADKVNAVEKTRLVYERSLESVDELFSSLQQRAFQGELSSESLRVS